MDDHGLVLKAMVATGDSPWLKEPRNPQLNSMVYGRYIELVEGCYKPTHISLGLWENVDILLPFCGSEPYDILVI